MRAGGTVIDSSAREVGQVRDGAMAAVTYYIGSRIGGGGIGDVAAQAVRGLLEHGLLRRLLVLDGEISGATDITARFPARLVRNRVADRFLPDSWRDALFDLWAARHLEDCDIFYGWACHSLCSLRRARRGGAVTLIDRGSAEARTQQRVLAEEFRSHGLGDGPMSEAVVRRMLEEYEETDCIAVPSTFVYETFRAAGYAEDRLFINPLGVDTDRFRPAPTGRRDGRFKVIFVGQVSLQKGVVYLLRAWRQLNLPDAELILVGPVERAAVGIIQEELRRMRPGSARLPGPTATPESFLAGASVLVLPSVQDGFGLVVLEAMACGVPVIVSESVGAKDCVREGVEGFVVPVRDVEALADRLLLLRDHPGQRDAMGRQARDRARGYSWEAYRSRLAERIQALSDQHAAPRAVAAAR